MHVVVVANVHAIMLNHDNGDVRLVDGDGLCTDARKDGFIGFDNGLCTGTDAIGKKTEILFFRYFIYIYIYVSNEHIQCVFIMRTR